MSRRLFDAICQTAHTHSSIIRVVSEEFRTNVNQQRFYSYGGGSTGTLKRFYDVASISEAAGAPGHWNILLDGRKVKTPSKQLLQVPSKTLALAIAAEFQYQGADYIRPITQPLYRLQWQTQHAAFTQQQIIDHLLRYVEHDSVCIRTPVEGLSTAKLGVEQETQLGRIVEWAQDKFDVTLNVSSSLFGGEQPPEVFLAYADFLQELPYPQLVAVSELAGTCKSLLISLAVLCRQLTTDQAVKATRLEEDTQMEQYGVVEGGHDLDIADLRTRVGGCAAFMHLYALDGAAAGAFDQTRHDIDKAMDALKDLGF